MNLINIKSLYFEGVFNIPDYFWDSLNADMLQIIEMPIISKLVSEL
jgi:hypothetical protein